MNIFHVDIPAVAAAILHDVEWSAMIFVHGQEGIRLCLEHH